MTRLRTRPLSESEAREYPDLIAHAFLADPDPSPAVGLRELFGPDRFHGIFDDARLIGGGGIQTRDLTVPGGPTPVAAVSYVGVRPDERGRGALSELMRTQLTGLHADGAEPVAVLWASMAPIYGRFGYGLASRKAAATVTAPAPFRPGAPAADGGTVRWYDGPAAAPLLRAVHGSVAPSRVGWLSRPEPSWRWWLVDSDRGRGNTATAYRYAVHHGDDPDVPEGYAVLRARASWSSTGPEYQLDVKELVACTPRAHAGLWRGMLDLDLVRTVRHGNVALDDPLPLLLLNPRGVLGEVGDGLWVRLVDLDRALSARRYAGPCDVVLEVTDVFCDWNAGRWRLRVDDEGVAEVTRTDAAAQLHCDVTDLGAAYLGGTRLTALAAAGRVRELRAGAVLGASRALAGDAEPYCPEVF